MFYGRPIKIVLDFLIKIIFSLFYFLWRKGKFCRSLIGAPKSFYITQNGFKMRKIWGLKLEKLESFFFKFFETKYHNPFSSLLVFASLLLWF
jgi:hypothetical protein